MSALAKPAVSFDPQAADFDLRAGLPAGVGERIAAALVALAPPGDGALLDLGAGTGQVGRHLAGRRLAGGRCRYLGMDLSGPMLAVFRRHHGVGPRPAAGFRAAASPATLLRADAAVPWPLRGGGVKLVFVSRAAHLLPPDLLVEETLRVASPDGALFVLGGVESEPDSLRAVLRRQMRRLLAEHGVRARQAGAARQALAGSLAERGGETLPVVTAASWQVHHSAGRALAAWRAKPGLGGQPVTPALQEEVLGRLETWIRRRYGTLEVEQAATERYQLAAVRLPPQRKSTEAGGNG